MKENIYIIVNDSGTVMGYKRSLFPYPEYLAYQTKERAEEEIAKYELKEPHNKGKLKIRNAVIDII